MKSAAKKDRLQHVIRVMTPARITQWNAYQSALENPYEDEDQLGPEFPRDILAAISAVPPMSDQKCRPVRVECPDLRACDDAWSCAIGSNTAAKNQREAATDLKIARLYACAKELPAKEREQRMIESLLVWLSRREPDLIDDDLYLRWCQSRAGAEVLRAGPDRVETFRTVLGAAASMRRNRTHGTGRGKNVG